MKKFILKVIFLFVGIARFAHAENCWIERDAWIDENGDKQIELNIYCSESDEDEIPKSWQI